MDSSSSASQGQQKISAFICDGTVSTSHVGDLSTSSHLDFLSDEFSALEALRSKGLDPPNPNVSPLQSLNECSKLLHQLPASQLPCDYQQAVAEESVDGGNNAESSSPFLDFLSPEFDALKALQTKGLQPPNPKVRPLDNLNRCITLLPQEVPESVMNIQPRAPRSAESVLAQKRAKARTSLVVQKTAERARQVKVFDAIAEKLKDGPLSFLAECYHQRGRVQVWTRHSHGLRGILTGFLGALDKHLNMVLHDVDEEYSVRRWVPRLVNKRGRIHTNKNVADKQSLDTIVAGDCTNYANISQEIEELNVKIKELRIFPKLEYRKRHLKQVFLRGDSIIMVRRLP